MRNWKLADMGLMEGKNRRTAKRKSVLFYVQYPCSEGKDYQE